MTGSIQGYVVTEDGRAVPGATVVIEEGPGPAPDIAPVTDEDGSFALDGLGEGAYLLRAFGSDGETGKTMVYVSPHAVTGVEIVL